MGTSTREASSSLGRNATPSQQSNNGETSKIQSQKNMRGNQRENRRDPKREQQRENNRGPQTENQREPRKEDHREPRKENHREPQRENQRGIREDNGGPQRNHREPQKEDQTEARRENQRGNGREMQPRNQREAQSENLHKEEESQKGNHRREAPKEKSSPNFSTKRTVTTYKVTGGSEPKKAWSDYDETDDTDVSQSPSDRSTFSCDLCNYRCSTQRHFTFHLNSRNHRQRADKAAALLDPQYIEKISQTVVIEEPPEGHKGEHPPSAPQARRPRAHKPKPNQWKPKD